MSSRNLTAVALVLSLGAAPLAAQTDSGEAGEAGGSEAGAAADSGVSGEAGAAESGTAGAGAEADAGAQAGAEADVEASAESDPSDGSEAAETAPDPAGPGEDGTAADDAAPEMEIGAETGEPRETGAGRDMPTDLEGLAEEESVTRVELGTLTCELEAFTNAVIYAEESFDCTFVNQAGRAVPYDGNISKVGANLQIKGDQTLQWVVLSSITADQPHDLSGTYLGASAQASLGVGTGANVLIGGSGDNFTLQPISLTGQEGLGASLTIDTLELSRAY